MNDAQHPLWVKESRESQPVLELLDIALKVTTVVYTAVVAWQTLKILCPPLAVEEQIILERIRRKLAGPPRKDVQVPHDALRDLYDSTR
jgi:hypothetical protein